MNDGSNGQAEPKPGKKLTAEQIDRIAGLRQRLATAFTQVTTALMATPRYRNMPLRDLEDVALQPLLHDRLAIAVAKPAEDEAAQSGLESVVGLAIWARVSAEADERIKEQVAAGVFPVRLKAADWSSGDIVWLLDVVAPNRRLAASVLAAFGKVAGKGEVMMHPVAARQIDAETLKQLGARTVAGPAA